MLGAFLKVDVKLVVDEYVEDVREHVNVLDDAGEKIADRSLGTNRQRVKDEWCKVETDDACKLGKSTKEVNEDVGDDEGVCFHFDRPLHAQLLLDFFRVDVDVHVYLVNLELLAEVGLDDQNELHVNDRVQDEYEKVIEEIVEKIENCQGRLGVEIESIYEENVGFVVENYRCFEFKKLGDGYHEAYEDD